MGILFATGFDHYTTILQRWTTTTGGGTASITSGGRNGTNCLQLTNDGSSAAAITVTKTLPASSGTFYAAFSLSVTGLPVATRSHNIIDFRDTGNVQLHVEVRSDGAVTIWKGDIGGTQITTVPNFLMLANITYHFEIGFSISATTGFLQFWVNGAKLLDLTNQDTKGYSGSAVANEVSLKQVPSVNHAGTSRNYNFDDLVVRDDAPSGDVQVRTYLPAAVGVTDQWVATGAGTTALATDETAPNDNTDYASTANSGDLSLWTIAASLNANAAFKAVQTIPRVEKTDAGTGQFLSTLRYAGANYQPGSVQSPSNGSYNYHPEIFMTLPGTTSPWTLAAVQSLQVGIQRTA